MGAKAQGGCGGSEDCHRSGGAGVRPPIGRAVGRWPEGEGEGPQWGQRLTSMGLLRGQRATWKRSAQRTPLAVVESVEDPL